MFIISNYKTFVHICEHPVSRNVLPVYMFLMYCKYFIFMSIPIIINEDLKKTTFFGLLV